MKPTRQQLIDAFAWTAQEREHVDPSMHLYKFLVQVDSMASAALWHMARLGLLDGPKFRILDLGSAVGMLAEACRMAGHEVVAVNAREQITELANQHLQIPIEFHHIKYGEPLPDWGTFDLIMLHGVDLAENGSQWDADQYAWLWRHLLERVRSSGMIDVFKNRGLECEWFCNFQTWPSRGFRCEVVDNVVQIYK